MLKLMDKKYLQLYAEKYAYLNLRTVTFICLKISKYYEVNAKNHNYLFLSAMVAKLEKAQSPIPNGVARTMKKIMHIEGRLLEQAVILFNCVPLQIGTFS